MNSRLHIYCLFIVIAAAVCFRCAGGESFSRQISETSSSRNRAIIAACLSHLMPVNVGNFVKGDTILNVGIFCAGKGPAPEWDYKPLLNRLSGYRAEVLPGEEILSTGNNIILTNRFTFIRNEPSLFLFIGDFSDTGKMYSAALGIYNPVFEKVSYVRFLKGKSPGGMPQPVRFIFGGAAGFAGTAALIVMLELLKRQ